MPYVIGLMPALGLCAFARQIRLDADRAFNPTGGRRSVCRSTVPQH